MPKGTVIVGWPGAGAKRALMICCDRDGQAIRLGRALQRADQLKLGQRVRFRDRLDRRGRREAYRAGVIA